MDLLIDSHPILWSMYEPERLSARAASLIGDRGNRLFPVDPLGGGARGGDSALIHAHLFPLSS